MFNYERCRKDDERGEKEMNDLIRLNNVSFVYPAGVKALSNINISFNKEEVIAIIGQNGSGKTTLAKHLNGLLKPTKGEVLVNGESTIKKTTAELSRVVGYVFQDPNDQIFMTRVYDEVSFGPKNLKLKEKEVKKNVKEALKLTGLWDKRKIHPLDLNINDKKMVAIASIMAMKPDLIILDEPTSGQDHKGIEKVKRLITTLRKKHSIIIISHNMELVSEVADKVVIMLNSRILFEGTPKQAFVKNKLLNKTYLKPPFITQLAQRTGLRKDVLTIEEFVEEVNKSRVSKPR